MMEDGISILYDGWERSVNDVDSRRMICPQDYWKR